MRNSPARGLVTDALARAGAQMTLSVEDRGIGMAPEAVARVFEKYYRAPNARRAAAGHGLGVAICRDLIEAHRGADLGRVGG